MMIAQRDRHLKPRGREAEADPPMFKER